MRKSVTLEGYALNMWDLQDKKLRSVGDTVMHVAMIPGNSPQHKWNVVTRLHQETLLEAYALFLERMMIWKETTKMKKTTFWR